VAPGQGEPLVDILAREGLTSKHTTQLRTLLAVPELQALGFRLIAFPVTGLFAVTHSLLAAMRTLKETGTTQGLLDQMLTFTQFTDLVGLPAY
jgi:2-methylisocitrate lyase-like PEP mutase family enzyme